MQKAAHDQKTLEATNLDLKKDKLQRNVKVILKKLILDQKTNQVKIERKGLKRGLGGKKAKVPRHVCLEPRICL
jgi:hypothetical protein